MQLETQENNHHIACGVVRGKFIFDRKKKRGFLFTPDKQRILVSLHPQLQLLVLSNPEEFRKPRNWVVYPSCIDPRTKSPEEEKLRLHLVKWVDKKQLKEDHFAVKGIVRYCGSQYMIVQIIPQTRRKKPFKLTIHFVEQRKFYQIGAEAELSVERRGIKLYLMEE